MTKSFFLLLISLSCLLAHAEEERLTRQLRVVDLKGSAYERGLQHGQQLRTEIAALLKLWKADLARRFERDPDEFIHTFFRKTKYRSATERWTPELLEEINGIAKGSSVDFETIYVFQLVDEYWVRGKMAGEHCSSIGVGPSRGVPPLLAQNLDLETFRDGFQTLLRIRDETGLETFVLTFPGFIGASGMNRKGVAVLPNTLDQLNNCDDGLPVACIIRGILNKENFKDADKFLHEVKHASGQNYMIGDPSGIADFECSAGKVARYGGHDVVWHTNHSLANDDFTPQWTTLLRNNPAAVQGGSSSVRFDSIARRVRELKHTPSISDVTVILRSKDSPQFPVCRPNSGGSGFSFASVVMMLRDPLELHIAAGPPNAHRYEVFRFKD